MRIRRQNHSTIRGIATLEVAVALPLLLILVFGAIEATNAIFLKQTVTTAAYEGARMASKTGGTTAQAETRCEEFLESRGITEFTFSTTPTEITPNTARGTQVIIHLSVAADSASLGPLFTYSGKTISRSFSMVRQ